jgi:DUF4097 and DUF4098 domain-containing protein YvlB
MIAERFDTPGKVRLDLRLAGGRIEVETSETETTEVSVDAHGSDDAVRELLEATRVEHHRSGDRHEVRVHVPKRGLFRRSVDVEIAVRAPHGADLRAQAASADTYGRGRLGAVAVDSASGDVELGTTEDAAVRSASGDVQIASVDGDATVSTASGDVRLGSVAGTSSVKSASGDVTLGQAGSDVSVSTASGDVELRAVARGRVELRSASGDVEIGIAKGSNVWVDARSMSGDMSSEVELGDTEPSGDEGPLVEVRAVSMSGDVKILRA